MSEERQITEAEWSVLEVLWRESPLSAGQVASRLKSERGWAENTVRTLLDRLHGKGCVWKYGADRPKFYEARVSRDNCVREEGRNFLSRIFGGEAAPLLLHFAREAELSPEQLRELRAILVEKDRS